MIQTLQDWPIFYITQGGLVPRQPWPELLNAFGVTLRGSPGEQPQSAEQALGRLCYVAGALAQPEIAFGRRSTPPRPARRDRSSPGAFAGRRDAGCIG